MTGEQLYRLWVAGNAANGVEVDTWDQLDEFDHQVWDDIGAQVVRAPDSDDFPEDYEV